MSNENKFTLSPLVVGEMLGQGGYGSVHEAHYEKWPNIRFAIKVFDPSNFHKEPSGVSLDRFWREAEILFRLHHPSIIKIYGVGEHGDKPSILMERFDGFNLVTMREKITSFEQTKVASFMLHLASGLAHAHSKGVIHRDIKPSNIMMDSDYNARMLDFGISVMLDPDQKRLTAVGNTLTGDMYTAPELDGDRRKATEQSDIYSLGCVWFWMLTGLSPTCGDRREELHQTAPMYENPVMKCISNHVDRRFKSAGELVQELRGLLSAGTRKTQRRASVGSAQELTANESTLLAFMISECPSSSDIIVLDHLRAVMLEGMGKLGFSIAYKSLCEKGLAKESIDDDGSPLVSITKSGHEWIRAHVAELEKIELPRLEGLEVIARRTFVPSDPGDDDIPF